MDCVKEMGHIIKKAAELTSDSGGIACAKLVVFANVQRIIHLWQVLFMEWVKQNV